jgi:hypothetical protein
MRSIFAILAAAVIGLAAVPTDASARPFGGGGFRGGGFHGGGFHGGGFRHGGFRGGGFGWGAPVALGLGLGLAAGYPYYSYAGYGDGCLRPRRIWTPYGWRVRWINVCGYGY